MMKVFTREQFKQGKQPTHTRDGREVLFAVDSGLDVQYPIVAWLDGVDVPYRYNKNGKNSDANLDLMYEAKIRNIRVALYKGKLNESCIYTLTEIGDSFSFDTCVENFRKQGRLIKVETIEIEED